MSTLLQFALLGLGAGAAYALLGQGLVLIFRGSGVLNLAHGAFAMAGAYGFYELRMGPGLGVVPALLVVVAASGAAGALLDQTIMRRLRRSSALARLIATLAILVILQAVGVLRYGAGSTLVESLVTSKPVHVLGAVVPSDRLWLVAFAAVLTAVLVAVWRVTRVGWVMAAVSESPRSAAALGWSPERVSAATWAAGCALAGLAGALIAPITQMTVTGLSLTVIAALAAALIGGFRSFGWTLAGGLMLGMGETVTRRYVDVPGSADAVPFLVIVVLLLVRGSSLPLRGYVTDRLPAVGTGRIDPRLLVVGLAAGAVLIGVVLAPPGISAVVTGLGVATVLLSMVVVTGFAGQLSLAQYALAGVGTLACARLVSSGWPLPLAMVVGVLVAGAVGLVLALPALRTRGVELAVVTLGLGVAVQQLVFANTTFTGSAEGTPVGDPKIFGFAIGLDAHPARYGLFALAVFAVAAVAVANLRRGRTGRRLLAVRANERGAAALGVGVAGAKLYAFAVGGAVAALGGIVLSFASTTVVYGSFGPLDSISAVAQAVIGGIGAVVGPVAGAVLAPGSVADSVAGGRYLPLAGGVLLLALLLVEPDGLVPAVTRRLGRLRGRSRDDRAPSSAARDADGPTSPAVREAGGASSPAAERSAPEGRSVRARPVDLRVEGLRVRYGGVVAVDGLDLRVGPGEVVGLIGPNGAGKSSVIDAISGFTPAEGTVALAGRDVSRSAPHRRAAAGLGRSFQNLELFEDLTVLENLQVASDPAGRAAMLVDPVRPTPAPLPPAALDAVAEFGLAADLHHRPDRLSYGRRRLVAIARAVAAGPSVLLLDEPAAGLDSAESRELGHLVRRLADRRGIGVLIVEHDMELVMALCDRVHVIDFGRPVVSGTPAVVRADPAARAAYLGDASTEDLEEAIA